jgi:hypothetical protein
MDKNRLDLNVRIDNFPQKPTIPSFSPRRRLYEPEATIPLFLPRETLFCFTGARVESSTLGSENVYFIQPVVKIPRLLIMVLLCPAYACRV